MKCDKTEALEVEGLASLVIKHAAFDLRESIISYFSSRAEPSDCLKMTRASRHFESSSGQRKPWALPVRPGD